MALAKHAGFIIPGYAWPLNWNQPVGTVIPGQIKAVGGTWAVLQTSYTMATMSDTTISSSSAVPDAGLTAMTQAAVAAGLKLCLKPHVGITGNNQMYVMPGAFYTANGAHYTSGSNVVSVPGATFDSSYIGRRIVTPTPGHYNEIPSGLNTMGTAPPSWTTVTGVVDSTHLTMSRNAAVSSGNATIAIPDDTAVQTWFANYQTILDHLISVVTSAGGTVEMLDISTEHDYATLLFDSNWRSLISYLRATYPTMKLTMSMGGNNGYGSVLCWDVLDYLGITWYKSVQASAAGGESYATIEANWNPYLAQLANWSAAWGNKRVIFTELGYRSIVGSGYIPYQTGQPVTVSQADQWACCQAFLRRVWNQPWFAGFHWWTWAHPQTVNPTGEITSYSMNAKQAETAFAQFLGAVPPRLITDGTVSYRSR